MWLPVSYFSSNRSRALRFFFLRGSSMSLITMVWASDGVGLDALRCLRLVEEPDVLALGMLKRCER